MADKIYHQPVMAGEVINALRPEPGDIIIDGTVGEGGHAEKIAEKIAPGGRLIGIDRDEENTSIAFRRLKIFDIKKNIFNDSYINVKKLIGELGVRKVDGVLLDLGFSSRQIKAGKRGFSFTGEEPLDMRYDVKNGITAQKWLNRATYNEITKILKKYGQEPESSYIAKSIIKHRKDAPINTNRQLSEIVSSAKFNKKPGINPATKTFQAIRIYINKEIENLGKSLINSLSVIKEGGRLAVLTYHSIEDREVKRTFRKYAGQCSCPPNFPICRCGAKDIRPSVKILKESGLRPSKKEVENNPSSRSAHLRVCQIEETNE